MSLNAFIGHAQALYGREAAAQATNRALEQAGRAPISLGLVVVSPEYSIPQVISSLNVLLGDTPLLGFTAPAAMTDAGVHPRSVAVALLSGDFSAEADWQASYAQDSRAAAERINQTLQLEHAHGTLMAIGDGLNGDADAFCSALPRGKFTLAGCLSAGNFQQGLSAQIGGKQGGSGGLAAARLDGDLTIGVGVSHGWHAVGAYFHVTKTSGSKVLTLDELPAADAYAQWTGYAGKNWRLPPLNELARLYPLGVEQTGEEELLLRSPLWVEADGSLRMNAAVPQGSAAHLLVGSMEGCLQAVQDAARQARQGLDGKQPSLVIVLADLAYQAMFESRPGAEIEIIQREFGAETPIIGGYCAGQFSQSNGRPVALNQHIEIIAFA